MIARTGNGPTWRQGAKPNALRSIPAAVGQYNDYHKRTLPQSRELWVARATRTIAPNGDVHGAVLVPRSASTKMNA